MHPTLTVLRQTPQPRPSQFLAANPGCWIQYYDDTDAKVQTKALSTQSFSSDIARRKQQDRCAVCFSLHAFGGSWTEEGLLSFRNLGVEVELVRAGERRTLAGAEIDRRKEEYLGRRLLPFPLQPHWLIETRHGFHVVFRLQPQRSPEGVRAALALNGRLVRALGGNADAAPLTQALRVPGTLQFTDPEHPFLCRLLLDNAWAIAPYGLNIVRSILNAQEGFEHAMDRGGPLDAAARLRRLVRNGGSQVSEGQRTTTAASIIGAIIRRLPADLWETAGWGGIKEWNLHNAAPLSGEDLRSLFESITRGERARIQSGRLFGADRVRIEVQIRLVDPAEGPSVASSGRGAGQYSPPRP